MRIELRVSGGVAGIRRPPVELETSGREDGAELEALAASVAAQPGDMGRGGPDRFQYDLRIDQVSVRLHEGALSPEAEALIDRLRGR
jgi:hypothetical protein